MEWVPVVEYVVVQRALLPFTRTILEVLPSLNVMVPVVGPP